jgi:hypothetical protein
MNNFFKKYHIIKLIIVILLNIFDILTTYFALASGVAKEINPLGSAIISQGWTYAISIKASILVLIAIYVIWAVKENKEKHAKWLLNIIMIFYILIVINNSIVLFW